MTPESAPIVADQEVADHQALEDFVVDNEDLERLESLLAEFNAFEAIGVVRQELRHSDFLAFLLDPRQSHGLGDTFLKRFLQRTLLAHRDRPLPVSLVDLDVWTLEETTVQREWAGIDILLRDDPHNLAVVIENKIGSAEHSNQLARYYQTVQRNIPTAAIIGLFLTPDGEEPSDERYLAISYGLVAELIDGVVTSRSSVLGPDVRMLLAHYKQMLRRHVVSGSDIDDLCQRIYRKHQRALDLIFERRPDQQLRVKEFLDGLIAQTPEVIADRATKGWIGFSPRQWEAILPRTEHKWSSNGRMLLFWFENLPNRLRLILEIGPGPSEVRERLFTLANENAPLLRTSKKLYASYSRIYARTVLTDKELEDHEFEALTVRVREYWRQFLADDLPRIVRIVCDGMASGGRLLSSKTRRSANRAAALLRIAAVNIGRTQTALGAFYRRLAARTGKAKAVTATARKLAILFYNALRFGMAYADPGASYYEERYRQRVLDHLRRRAQQVGFTLVANAPSHG